MHAKRYFYVNKNSLSPFAKSLSAVQRKTSVPNIIADSDCTRFPLFAEVEISHGRVIVLDKVEGRLTTSPVIEQTFTVQLQ